MTIYPQERIALFIDGSNLYAAARALGFDIDYKRLLEIFAEKGHLVRAFYYTALVEDQEYSPIRPLVDWLDYNGHMTESRYLDAFALSTDRFMEMIGCDSDYIADPQGGSYFTAETHIRHLSEAHAGDQITVRTQLLLGQGKKLHLFHRMYRGEELIATGEHFLLHVSLETRKPSAPSAAIEAAMNPAQTDYIFFVADGSGGHAFAATLEEHNRNVAEWRRIEAERAAQEN